MPNITADYPMFGQQTEEGSVYPLGGFGYKYTRCITCRREWVCSVFIYPDTPLCPDHWTEDTNVFLDEDSDEWSPSVWRYADEATWHRMETDWFVRWVSDCRRADGAE